MNVVPLSRRPRFIAIIGLTIIVLIYAWALLAAGDVAAPIPFFSRLGFGLSLILSLGLILFILLLALRVTETKHWIGIFFRLILSMVWFALNMLVFIDNEPGLLRTFVSHLDLAMFALLFFIALFAQFTLPVHDLQERWDGIRRLLGFLLGERGPVTFIRNGEAVESHGERSRKGPGVFLIDYASAAVLRTDVAFTRAVGPGLVFSKPGEWLGEAIDLRPQLRSVKGFTPPTGAPADLEAVNSLAVTKDGIPVSTDLAVTFMLEPDPGLNNKAIGSTDQPPYPYHREAVEKAVYGHAYGEFEDLPWTELPLRLAIDLWRDVIKEKSLKELTVYMEHSDPPLMDINKSILQRLAPPIEDPTEDEAPEKPELGSEHKILASRGIRVLSVEASHLYLPDDVRFERLAEWRHAWSGDIQAAVTDAREEAYRASHQGEAEASYVLFQKLTSTLYDQLSRSQKPNRRDTLNYIINDAYELCGEDRMVEDGITMAGQLSQISNELSNLDGDCGDVQAGRRS
jgi:hypothetical protein